MSYKVRSASEEDVPFLAWVMYQSMIPGPGKGLFDDALADTGTSPLRFNEALLTTGSNNWGQLDSFLVTEDPDGRICGAMAAFSGAMEDLRPLTASGLAAVSSHLGWSEAVSRSFWHRYISFFGPFGKAPQLAHAADYVLEYGAVSPQHRGRGLYQKLFGGHRDRARTRGEDAMSGSAVYGNDIVIRSLERFGFKEAMRIGPETYLNKFPGMIRFRYDIVDPN